MLKWRNDLSNILKYFPVLIFILQESFSYSFFPEKIKSFVRKIFSRAHSEVHSGAHSIAHFIAHPHWILWASLWDRTCKCITFENEMYGERSMETTFIPKMLNTKIRKSCRNTFCITKKNIIKLSRLHILGIIARLINENYWFDRAQCGVKHWWFRNEKKYPPYFLWWF